MAQVTVDINGRGYVVACADGEEERTRRLAAYMSRIVNDLTAQTGRGTAMVGDAHLLLLAGLTIADELSDTYEKLESAGTSSEAEAEAARVLDELAGRLEGLAARLERH